MNLLEGSIAFALALGGFATICTVLVETLHRTAGLRSSDLKQMLEAYFEATIKPKLAGEDAERLKQDLLNRLLHNPLIDKYITDTPVGRIRLRLLESSEVSTEDFLRRLPESELFQKLKQDSSEQAQALTQELADKYDQFGAAASGYFKSRAQLISILVGILLAVTANIHAVRLFDTFVKNPELALQMQAQAENIRQELKALPAHKSHAGDDEARPPAATPDQEGATSPDNDGDAAAEIEKNLKKVTDSLRSYEEIGLPIGWDYYPYCQSPASKDPQCEPIFKQRAAEAEARAKKQAGEQADSPGSNSKPQEQDFGVRMKWLFGVILTGLLIGLGGPFWFDVAVRLSQVRQVMTGKPAIQPLVDAPVASDRDKAIADTAKRLSPQQDANAVQG